MCVDRLALAWNTSCTGHPSGARRSAIPLALSLRYALMQMDIVKMLAALRQEREQIVEAIVTLERLAYGRGKRRGRPPKWMTVIKKRGRPPGSKNKLETNGPSD